MVRWIMIAVLSLGIAGTAIWGYQEHQEKNEILIQAENTYQRAFHELTYHMDLLHDKIGVALAVSSNERLSPQLVEIWRLTSEALSNVGQLPLALLPFNKTEEFLSDIGEFTYRTAVRDLDKDPLTNQEMNSLKDLYSEAEDIQAELREVQHVVLKDNLRWMDVQLALATQDEPMDNTIIDGFETVEKRVGEYTEGNIDSAIIGVSSQEHSYEFLTGDNITEDEALIRGKKLFNIDQEGNMKITKSGDGSDVPIYSISYRNGDKNAYLDMTEQGGHPITLLVNRSIKEKKLSLHDGMEKAKQYLETFDFDNMIVFQSSEFNNIGVYSFLYSEDDIRVHSDAIEVKVALDNGDILGLTAQNYFMNHRDRDIPKPDITEDEAEDLINSNVDVQEKYLAIIDNDFGEEVLAYEFLGTYEEDTYRIFINAMNGNEEKVERLSGTEINFSQNF